MRAAFLLFLLCGLRLDAQTTSQAPLTDAGQNSWLAVMGKAAAHAAAHHAHAPSLSPVDRTAAPAAFGLPAGTPSVPVAALQQRGIRVIPWTTNDPEAMRAVIRTGVDGLITDRPDLLQQTLAEERRARPDDPKLQQLCRFSPPRRPRAAA